MRTVRYNVFETNSSSTHSITLCNRETYDDWADGKLYWRDEEFCEMPEEYKNFTDEQWFALLVEKEYIYEEDGVYWVDTSASYWDKTRENYNSMEEAYKNQKEWLIDFYLYDYKELYNVKIYEEIKEEGYDSFYDSYTTESGEKIVAFGYYGYDG